MKTVSFVRRKFNAMLGVATVSMAVNFVVMLSGSLIAGNLLGKEGLAGIRALEGSDPNGGVKVVGFGDSVAARRLSRSDAAAHSEDFL